MKSPIRSSLPPERYVPVTAVAPSCNPRVRWARSVLPAVDVELARLGTSVEQPGEEEAALGGVGDAPGSPGESDGVAPSPRTPRASRWARSQGPGRRGAPPPPAIGGTGSSTHGHGLPRRRPCPAQPAADVVSQTASRSMADCPTSVTSASRGLPAPASMSAARWSAPPAYCSTDSPRSAASSMRTWESALRARWVRRWPTVQPGSRLGRRTVASSIDRIVANRRRWAARHPATPPRSFAIGASRPANHEDRVWESSHSRRGASDHSRSRSK